MDEKGDSGLNDQAFNALLRSSVRKDLLNLDFYLFLFLAPAQNGQKPGFV